MTLTTLPKRTVPALPLRGLVVFPNMLLHFDVSRVRSVRALDEAMSSGRPIFLVPQRDLSVEEPRGEDLAPVGVLCNVRQLLRLPGGNIRALVEGTARGRITRFLRKTPYLEVEMEELPARRPGKNSARTEALVRETYGIFEEYMELAAGSTPETMLAVLASDDPGYIADYIIQNIPARPEDKQVILEELHPTRRLEKLQRILRRETEILRLETSVQGQAQEAMDANQRDYFLREQLRAIRRELGEEEDELSEYRKKIEASGMPQEAAQRLLKELSRMEKQPYGSAEATVSRNYLDVCLELPWGKLSREKADVESARRTLDRDHYGLSKVKERILEYVAVRQLTPDVQGQILCLVGPPGVGKTSIAGSIARALGRKMARVSLGGVHDEAEIRGHRKTYVGAMPGRIIMGLRQAGTSNPVLVLDEIDKLGTDGRSDPASALLEVLDGEQNGTFRDNFLEIPYDLSQVLFITTANTLDTIPRPLLDRMEVIELPSYTDEEKLHIAKEHLLPRQLKRHGLKKGQFKVTEGALRTVIARYTRESGVRILERRLAALCRRGAMKIVSGSSRVTVREDDLEEYLGPPKYHRELDALAQRIGVVNGLAWTEAGGELLEVEVNVMSGSGKVELTGNLGEVMKESAKTAVSYLRSQAKTLGLEQNFYKTRDIHIHFPEGAVPKDGPSAGIAIATAIASALRNAPVRPGVAMTGEVTLRGRVLAIGGLREKTMAALRNGIQTVLIPKENEKDLAEIDQEVRAQLRFCPVERVDEVLALTLPEPPAGRRERPLPPALENQHGLRQ